MSFMLYVVGFVAFVAGLASLGIALGLAETYATSGALTLLAAGLVTGLVRNRSRRGSATA